MFPALSFSVQIDGPTVAAIVALVGALVGIWVNGDRAERQRRRALHARALKSVIEYGEMPFVIRRRRCEPEHRSEDRVRISDHFSAVKAEAESCRALLNADGDAQLARSFEALYSTARRVVGSEAHLAWKDEPVSADSEMNMGELYGRLSEFHGDLELFHGDLGWATLPQRKRLWRRLRGRGSSTGLGS